MFLDGIYVVNKNAVLPKEAKTSTVIAWSWYLILHEILKSNKNEINEITQFKFNFYNYTKYFKDSH